MKMTRVPSLIPLYPFYLQIQSSSGVDTDMDAAVAPTHILPSYFSSSLF